MKSVAPAIAMVTPLPPAQTGIAQYSQDLIDAVADEWNWKIIPEQCEDRRTMRIRDRVMTSWTGPTILQVGNSGFHRRAMDLATRAGALLVLHDVVLHHGRLGEFIRTRNSSSYRMLMEHLYGDDGKEVAEQVLRGFMPPDVSRYPLSEDLIARSALTVVHSEFARSLVLQRVPDARVAVVPMGVPLPALVEQELARKAMNIPQSAFVIASITRVNPNKRLPVVFRALRRIVNRLPETQLVIAGAADNAVDLNGMVHFYNVERHVKVLGYVSTEEARLVARAADVCVNLRYPSTGETSASLLRLLGAGRPVIVTDDSWTREYPRDAVLPVAVDRFEEEILAELFLLLADRGDIRDKAGSAARGFVERQHSMDVMVNGYRRAIEGAFGIGFPSVAIRNRDELPPVIHHPPVSEQREHSGVDEVIVDALSGTGIGAHRSTIETVVRHARSLTLANTGHIRQGVMSMTKPDNAIRSELLEILACPACKSPVRLEGDELVCEGCQRRYQIEDGFPVMLLEDKI